VTIGGTNFQSGATTQFGGAAATGVTVVSSTRITATTPAHAAGKVDVQVTNPDGKMGTAVGAFTFAEAPTISGVSPNTGPSAGGTSVTITGTGFQTGASVYFSSAAATGVSVNSATQIQATTPANDAGAVYVVVTNPDGLMATLSGGFTYVAPPPTVTGVAPNYGLPAGGTAVTITGTGFQTGAAVTFGGVAGTGVNVLSATQIQAVTPAHATGAVDVRVTNPDSQGATLAGGFAYGTPPPAIIRISPSGGTTAGGTLVTITGTGFQPGVPGTRVTFGGVAGTGVNVLSATQIQAVTPAHATAAVDVRVTNPDSQSATRTGGFTYTTGGVTISSVSPEVGSTAGNTAVTITGSGFQSGATVTFGGVGATGVNVTSSTQITAKTPAQASPGSVDVAVTNPDSSSGVLANGFNYEAVPSTVYFNDDFESGTTEHQFVSGATAPAVVASGDNGVVAQSGTQMLKCVVSQTNANTSSKPTYVFGNASAPWLSDAYPANPALSNANGLFIRFWMLVHSDAVANLQRYEGPPCGLNDFGASPCGQIKLLINRWQNRNTASGWLILTWGPESSSSWPNVSAIVDTGLGGEGQVGFLNLFAITADEWVEVQTWMKSTSSSVTNQVIATGNGVTTTFTNLSTAIGLAPCSLTITAGAATGADNCSGSISGSGISGSIGTYFQGTISSLTFSNPPPNGQQILASYTQGAGEEKVWVNGNLVVQTGPRHDMGNADPASQQQWQGGLTYTQDSGGAPMTIYVDNVEAADGYIDP
jgi:hypothetical protein